MRLVSTIVPGVMLVVVLALIGVTSSVARGADNDIAKLIGHAKTVSDHEQLAAYYENKAKEAKHQAEQHSFEANAYGYSNEGIYQPYFSLEDAWEHCQRLVRIYEEAADADTYLARQHRAAAAALRAKSGAGQK